MTRPLQHLVTQIRMAGLPAPAAEYHFAPEVEGKPVRRWRFDLAWPAEQVALELEGSLFTGGRHGGARSSLRDVEKYNAAALLGWRVIRTVPTMVRSGAALVLVEVALGKRGVGEVL